MLSINSCAPAIKINADYDKSLNIKNDKTYSWLNLNEIEGKGLNPAYYNELTDKRIKTAVDKEMQAKGYKLLEKGNTDLEIHYHISVENKTTIVEEYDRIKDSPYWPTRKIYTYEYREGSLLIDLMDVKKNALVWRGIATSVITDKVSKNPEGTINKAVSSIFTLFPFSSF